VAAPTLTQSIFEANYPDPMVHVAADPQANDTAHVASDTQADDLGSMAHVASDAQDQVAEARAIVNAAGNFNVIRCVISLYSN